MVKSVGFKKKKSEANFCYYCFRPLTPSNRNGKHFDNTSTVDHFIPSSAQGTSWQYNLVICCRSCNLLKGDLSPDNFLELLIGIARTGRHPKHTKKDIQSIIKQVKYISSVYEQNKQTNQPYILTELPHKMGLLEQLRLKFKTNEFPLSDHQYRQAAQC